VSWGPGPGTTVVLRPRAESRFATVLQLTPLLPILLTMIGVQVVDRWSLPVLGMAVAVTSLVQFTVAWRDKQLLDSRGFAGLAPASLALVSSLLYLGVRARCCSGHDRTASDPILWAVVTTVAAVVIALVASFVQAGLDGLSAATPTPASTDLTGISGLTGLLGLGG
jgi:protein-S-isoprenylcysteine O-methyltransferase Ste14